ncbi:MAG: NlpC/P60 family protein [Bacillota bacterium]|nr:NlpC/P60 family protein [Bacillota bacterium]
MKKKVICSILAFCLILTFSASAYANPISDQKAKLQDQQSQYNDVDDDIDDSQGDIDKLEGIVQNLNKQVSVLNSKISAANVKISSKEKDIVNTQKEIDKLIKDIADKQELLDTRVRAMYINGNDSYLSYLLDSDGFSDFLSRMEFVKKLVSLDKETIEELNNSRKYIENKKKALEKEKADLVNLKSGLEKDKAEVTAKKKIQQQGLNALNAKKAALEAQRAQYASQINATKAKIEALIKAEAEAAKKQSDPSRGNDGGTAVSAGGVVEFAYKYLGCPYVWGATGQVLTRSMLNWAKAQGHYSPFQEQFVGKSQAFDCSGLVVYVYAHFGVSMQRTTYYQVNQGRYIPKGSLQAGDLIFFGSSRNVYHVGIYIGDGLMIEAPYTGSVVRISPAFRSDYYTARRVR